MNRDELRSLTIGAPRIFKSKLVDIPGGQVEMRVPTVKQRAAIFQSATRAVLGKDGEVQVDQAKLPVCAVIACAHVPGTDSKLFDPADEEALLSQPIGGWFDVLTKVAMEFVSGKTEELEKNSEPTPADSSSSK